MDSLAASKSSLYPSREGQPVMGNRDLFLFARERQPFAGDRGSFSLLRRRQPFAGNKSALCPLLARHSGHLNGSSFPCLRKPRSRAASKDGRRPVL